MTSPAFYRSECQGTRWRRLVAVWMCVLLLAPLAFASDHADPIMLSDLEAGITDLFAFPKDEKLVLIVCVRRGLTTAPPLELESYLYAINIDLHSEVNYDDSDVVGRYGGKVLEPGEIRADVTIDLRLNDDATLKRLTTQGLQHDVVIEGGRQEEEHIRWWTGVRDDPFIFFRFSTTNVVAMVVEIPLSQFPENQTQFLIWATSSKLGKQIDHVGRSLRTMLPRFDYLNTLPPSEQVDAIRERHTDPGVIQDVLGTYLSPLFAIRHYDFEPDVMIFNASREVGYPNGRRLEDDVAELCCKQGDCLLWELSLADAHAEQQARPTKNNKPFLKEFPYLAAPNPERPPPPSPSLKLRTKIILAVTGILALAFLLLPSVLLWRCRRTLAAIRAAGQPMPT